MAIVLRSVVEESSKDRDVKTASNGRVQPQEKDSLERGFRLAYFLVPDRSRAIEILCGALEKQEVQSFRENRRFYWRDKHPQHAVRRVTRRASDVLQWLIMAEAECYEREQEESAYPSQAQMIIRYVKHVVGITSTMSSFYVNVGVNRVLHAYNTAEAQAAYEEVTGRTLEGDEYRRVKRLLMRRILDRFGDLLRTSRVSRGEIRFELREDQKAWSGLVRECLQRFTPWSTGMICESRAASAVSTGPGADRNDAEMDHCHVFIEPVCHMRLMKSIGSATPAEKLALPKLFLADDDQDGRDSDDRTDPVPLSTEERNRIREYLRIRKRRRRQTAPRRIQILVDGVECAWLDTEEQTTLDLSIEEGANLIEIRGQDAAGDVLLGTHLIEYDESGFATGKAKFILEAESIGLEVLPVATQEGLPLVATVRFSLHVHSAVQVKQGFAMWLDLMLSAGRKIALPAATFFMGMLIAAVLDRKLPVEKSPTEQQVASVHEQPLAPSHASHESWYRLFPDEDITRGGRSSGLPTVSIDHDSDLLRFELPIEAITERVSDYAVELWAVDGNARILDYDSLKPQYTSHGNALKVPVPAAVLKPEAYYTFKLLVRQRSRREWLSNFSFQVLSGPVDEPTRSR